MSDQPPPQGPPTGSQPPGQTAEGGPPTAPEGARPGPPDDRLGPRQWAREKLFGTWYDTLLTVVFGALLVYAIYAALAFAFVNARWTVIRVNLTNLLVGLFPRPELWRVWLALFLGTAIAGVAVGLLRRTVEEAAVAEDVAAGGDRLPRVSGLRRTWPILSLLGVLLAFSGAILPVLLVAALLVLAVASFVAGRRIPSRFQRSAWVTVAVGMLGVFAVLLVGGVGWDSWGGLLLTLFLAVTGIVLSFPIGVALALGRRSSFPAVRVVSVLYIELVRGVPLITILFMGSFMLGFFFPPSIRPGLVVRAIISLTIFTAAYVAEIVRGGLQSVPRGQVEAAQAVGLPPLKVTRRIVLPQALRAVIPALVGQFISLFKDTSLVAIIGGTELLFFAQNITNQPRFTGQGLQAETLVFAAFIYWVFAYTMSKESQRLEKRLGVGER